MTGGANEDRQSLTLHPSAVILIWGPVGPNSAIFSNCEDRGPLLHFPRHSLEQYVCGLPLWLEAIFGLDDG